MNQKRFVLYALSFAIMISCICVNAYATENEMEPTDTVTVEAVGTERDEIVAAAEDFLQAYTENTFLYESNDLNKYTVASLKDRAVLISVSNSPFSPCIASKEYLKETVLRDQTAYISEKAGYLKAMRQMQGIERENFEVAYDVHEVNVNGRYAQVYLTEEKSFNYVGETMDSYLADEYELMLVHTDGNWLVFDMTSEDGFDSCYKNADFTAKAAIKEFEAGYTAYLNENNNN